ncbi:flavin-containing monooxygenase [Kytococcus sedentarius]|uniref:flavin-containing monooxygenase n=1 Tax=Kytococcus sedentarius TaxID=1276 RepID=UPI0035BC2678
MTRHTVAVIGAGFGGVSVVDALARHGIHDVVVVDERAGIGGRWLDRLDPGARSRSSLSESTLPDHPRTRAESSPSAEAMRAYLQRIAAWASMGERLLADRVTTATQGEDGAWTLALESGDTVAAQFLVLATGLEGDPVIPEIRGMDAFEGPLLHTHVWDPTEDLAGRHVAVLTHPTTGHLAPLDHVHAAAALAETASRVTVFSPDQPWILPERPSTDPVDLFLSNARVRAAGSRARRMNQVVRAALPAPAQAPWEVAETVLRPSPMPWQRAMHDATHLARQHLDPVTLEHHHASTPVSRGTVRCETWFHGVARDRLHLLRIGIHRITPDAVVDVNGTRHRVDAIVLATGTEPAGPGSGIDGLDPTTGGLLAEWSPHLGTIGRVANLMVTGGPASDLPVGGDAEVFGARADLVARLVAATVHRGARTVRATPDAVGRWERRVTGLQGEAGLERDPGAIMWPGVRRDLVRLLRGDPDDFVLG